MPSNKTPSVVNPGTGLPVSTSAAALAIGEALQAHIDDPVDAHMASAIGYLGGALWADGTAVPDNGTQLALDNIVQTLARKTTVSGAGKIGSAAIAASFTNAPYSLSADELQPQLSNLLLFANTPYRAVTVDNATPYSITSATRVTHIFVDGSGGTTSLTLPTTPLNHKGWVWHVYDISGNSPSQNLTISRAGVYAINGILGDITVGKQWGQWAITCDGLNFFIEECQQPYAPPPLVNSSPFNLDAALSLPNDLLFINTTAARTINTPIPTLALKGRRWILIDISGQSTRYNITLTPSGGTINGLAGVSVGKDYGRWELTCDGANWYVQESMAPIPAPLAVNGGNSPYTLDSSGQNDDWLLIDTSAIRTLVLPQTPAAHKGQSWRILDAKGTSVDFPIAISRYGGSTYKVNGSTSATPVDPLSGEFGEWTIFCDGTDFYINQLRGTRENPYRTVVLNDANNPVYLDAGNERDAIVLVGDCAALRDIYLPLDASLHKGQRWLIIDTVTTTATTIFIKRAVGATYKINGAAANSGFVGGLRSSALITCDGTDFFYTICNPGPGILNAVSQSWTGANGFFGTTNFLDQVTISGNHYIDFDAADVLAGLRVLRRSGTGTTPGYQLALIAAQGQAPTGAGVANNDGGDIRVYPGSPSTEGLAGTGETGDLIITWSHGSSDDYERHITSRDISVTTTVVSETKVILTVPMDTKLQIHAEVWLMITNSGSSRFFSSHLDYGAVRESGGTIREGGPTYTVDSVFENGGAITNAGIAKNAGQTGYEIKATFGGTGTYACKVFIVERGSYYTWPI